MTTDAAPEPIAPRRVLRILAVMAATIVLALGATLALPFDRYLAWQAASGTQMFHARWIYERIVFDRTPIEVAVIGSSRLESGISPAILSADLSRRLGRSVPVANLSLVMPGRDFTATTVRLLLEHHPEVRLILLTDDGDIVNSHPMFRETASARDLLAAPALVNGSYLPNLLALPYRNLTNVAQQVWPAAFGITRRFDSAAYAGAGLDRTLGYRVPGGESINGDLHRPAPELAAMSRAAVARQVAGLRWTRWLPDDRRLAVDRHYVATIAADARAKGVRVAFLKLPLYGPVQSPGEDRAYRAIGPVFAFRDLSRDPTLYQSAAHLNRRGAEQASVRVAAAVAPLLAGAAR
ncbi:hypothetical protein [Sphingomonas sp. Leaf4]|uniref:hypothetical protein n=1 Tax=Sphingomonas sp. Leaf4 TaxID=2876553 RepID=UPI001E2D8233|nr:hypothetical protein [Sphingomonas sp. Leaf4]